MEKPNYSIEDVKKEFESKMQGASALEQGSISIEEIEELYRKKAFIEVVFTSTSKKHGIFRGQYKGVSFTMDKREMYGKPDMPDQFMNKFVGVVNRVLIKSVDVENKTFKVSVHDAVNKGKDIVINYVKSKLSVDEVPVVDAIVEGYDKKKNRITLNVFSLGITGFVVPAEWSYCFTGDMEPIFKEKKGTVISVGVLDVIASRLVDSSVDGHKVKRREQMKFVCSRKAAIEDPWIGIEEEYVPNDTVLVKCIDRKSNASGFFAEIQGLEDIHAFCYYPDNSNELPIVEGVWYKGYVKQVSEEKRKLMVKVFEVVRGMK